MKICRVVCKGNESFGILDSDSVRLFDPSARLENLSEEAPEGEEVAVSDVRFLPPVRPSKIVCIGRNYAEHAAELGNEVPAEPLLFLKAPSALITEGEPIVIPPQSDRVEHEGELAIVIGRECKNISDDSDPLRFVRGYLCLNDVTARDLQRRDIQFTRAKSFDTFCPVGRYFETSADVSDIPVETLVNGEVRQSGRTSRMVFPVPFLIRFISRQMTLCPGDLVATGTPSGVSRLSDGDVVEVRIGNVGTLSNPVINGHENF